MSGRVLYHSVIPENNRPDSLGYGELDVVDFLVSFPERMLVLNKIRITGDLEVFTDTAQTTPITTQRVQFDELVGAHSLLQSVQTFASGQSIDNVMDYPRVVKVLTAASENGNDMNKASNLCELKAPAPIVAEELLRKEKVPVQQATPRTQTVDFSIKPMIAINSVMGSRDMLSYSKSGDVRVSITFNRNSSALFGTGCDANTNYKVSNLRLEAMSYPDDGDMSPIVCKKRMSLKQSFEGSSAQLNFNYPMLSNKVYGSFLINADENVPAKNNTKLNKVPNIDRLSFFWSNTTNEYISYQLRSSPEILDRAISAIGDTGKNEASLKKLSDNNGFLVGLHLNEFVDLMRTKLSLVIDSANIDNMICFLIAEGILQL